MKLDTAPFRNWFGYTRRERRASFILLFLIVFVISVRFLFPEKRTSIKNISLEFATEANGSQSYQQGYVVETGNKHTYSGKTLADRSLHDKLKRDESGKTAMWNTYQKKKPLVVDVNRCDTSELIKLPGIGPVLSKRIIKYRQLLGGFYRKEQLSEVYGLPTETYDLIKEMLFVDTLLISKTDINTADYKILYRMPYFDRNEITAILKYRELGGKIKGINELVNNKIITEEKAFKVRPYLSFD